MKKIVKLIMILSLIVLTSCGKKVTEYEALQMLNNHLIKRYGEEFVIGFGGRRGYTVGDKKVAWYEYEITPLSYDGTNKLHDKYYDCIGTVEIEEDFWGEKLTTPGDSYAFVLLKESANEFYGKKLKELFGENVLPVLEINGIYSDEKKDFMSSVELTAQKNRALYVRGGIYIFGRVENDEDREWYRKQIYEFVQFMKQTGTFEYVRLSIYIIDERMLVNGAEKCFENIKYTSKTRKGITKEIDKALNPMTEEYNKLTTQEKLIKLSSYNKGNILNEIRGILLLVPIASPKYIDSNSFSDDEITELFGRKKEYNNINDIQFKYEDYAIKEVKNE